MKNKNILSLFILSAFITSSIFCTQPATTDETIALEKSKIISLENKLASLKPSTPEEQIKYICLNALVGGIGGALIGCIISRKEAHKEERKGMIITGTLLLSAVGIIGAFWSRHDIHHKKRDAILTDINTSNTFINNLLLSKEQVVRSS